MTKSEPSPSAEHRVAPSQDRVCGETGAEQAEEDRAERTLPDLSHGPGPVGLLAVMAQGQTIDT
jgi:hypothetical protein